MGLKNIFEKYDNIKNFYEIIANSEIAGRGDGAFLNQK